MLPVTTMSMSPGMAFSAWTSSSTSSRSTDAVLLARVVERRGHDVLGHTVEVVGRARRVVGLERPVPAEVLEGLASEHEGVGRRALLPHGVLEVGSIDLGVGAGIEPTLGHVDHP